MTASAAPQCAGVQSVLRPAQWKPAEEHHHARVDDLLAAHSARQSRGVEHPVEDFLFTYYSHRPGQLRRWHPGIGVRLADAADAARATWPFYRVCADAVEADVVEFGSRRDQTVRRTVAVLSATSARAPAFGCFGMHEWAMVYRLAGSGPRHADWPLRLRPDAIDAAVEQRQLACTHFDAFRFFTADARPLNSVELQRADEVRNEQPGCLHAGMDLYRWAYKLSPLTPSSLVLDCFELARDIRYLDMRASPYDFTDLGLTPVPVESAAGRAEYAAAQREFAIRAAPLRAAILQVAHSGLAAVESATASR